VSPDVERPREGNGGAGPAPGETRETDGGEARSAAAEREGARFGPVLAGVVFVGVQILVPVRGLLSDGQDRWSWEMFSRVHREAQVEVRYRDRVSFRSLGDVLVVSRREIGPVGRLARDLCRHYRGAIRVRVDTVVRPCERR